MPNPMYKYQMPTEKLKDQLAEARSKVDRITTEYDKIIDEQVENIESLRRRIVELEQRDAILTALEAGGVDNWEGYEPSLEEMNSDD